MLHYILQTIAFQLFFLLVFDLFLKHETFFNWNRFYLLFTPIASLILPVIKINSFKQLVPQSYVIQLPEVILNPDANTLQTQLLPTVYLKNSTSFWSWETILYLGVVVAAVIFLVKIYRLIKTIVNSYKNEENGLTIVTIKNSTTAFSFFNYVFLGDCIPKHTYATILSHESVHIKQKHSIDLLLFELLRILFWFNPLVYMYQNRMVTLHEYIADALVVKHQDKTTYYQNLLSQVFDVNHISFINPFFKQSLIKKRIIMLTKSKSKQIHLLKYALLVPMVCSMLLYTSCDKEADNSESTEMKTSEEQLQEKIDKLMEENPNVKIEISDVESTSDVDVEVPYSVVEHPPVFSGCEDVPTAEQKNCFSGKISQFVGQNFNTDLATTLGLSGRQRISVLFKIDKSGDIKDVKARAPHPELEAEAIRVINKLPKMQPGKQKGKEVTVPYVLPIVFEVQE
ncbi:blaR1 peptidase M56 family protein [Formosa sediminum]|uniref:BlaR1 peptidase M56 family protein n=1 Tax=Formosa sediminum TaxID=2594004 RepID=A0A516GQ41_9FLAO|nr:M56 family metallopeptidase [Formosa sediminum]QDO93644.1 blaR1 peptidase M56 family protein [Formosa sediminum]